uniref:Uncharacterized protein n=1 Tax=Kalanchoe fedtschenkoi TaxID=63787 RepID=A0A7N0T2P2_KALFE
MGKLCCSDDDSGGGGGLDLTRLLIAAIIALVLFMPCSPTRQQRGVYAIYRCKY